MERRGPEPLHTHGRGSRRRRFGDRSRSFPRGFRQSRDPRRTAARKRQADPHQRRQPARNGAQHGLLCHTRGDGARHPRDEAAQHKCRAHVPLPRHAAVVRPLRQVRLYVVDEANIESHGYHYRDKSKNLAGNPSFAAAHLDRNRRMVFRDYNHPSIIVWSTATRPETAPTSNAATTGSSPSIRHARCSTSRPLTTGTTTPTSSARCIGATTNARNTSPTIPRNRLSNANTPTPWAIRWVDSRSIGT